MRRLLVLTLVVAACGGKNSNNNADAPQGTPDVPVTNPDAPVTNPDAMLPPDTIVQCTTPVPAPTDGACDATAGTGTAVVLRGNVLGDGIVYKDGGVIYDGGKITYVGCEYASQSSYATAAHVDCAGAAISPGLINPHSHLNYNDRWPLPSTAAGGTRYQQRNQWRDAISTPTNKYGTAKAGNGNRWGELREVINGTTSIDESTIATGMARNLDTPEASDVAAGLKGVDYEVFMLGDSNQHTTVKPNCTWSYAESEFEVYLEHYLVTHTAEGINDYAHQEFLCQSTSFGGGHDFTEKNASHIHAIALDAKDLYSMAHDRSGMIWAPRSNISLYGNTAQPQVLARLGGFVALSTDWTYSGSATMPRELACAASWNHDQLADFFSDEDLWKMATINAAKASGADDVLGSITVGKLADLAIFADPNGKLHGAVIGPTTDKVALVIKGGKPMSGEADVVSALGPACDPVTVCGASFQICASREYAGQTYDQLHTLVTPEAETVPPAPPDTNNAYPAIFCDTPPIEPTCAPSRPGEYAGATATDADGDGVPDATDDCPNVFNAIRPMDKGVQSDVDGDGIGDACDPTPVGDDMDADTIPNMVDNCPNVSNTDQADDDSDGKGNACDFCPNVANSDHVCLPLPSSIVMVQNGTIAPGNSVIIADVIVTAIDSKGFTAQDPTVADGKYAGVYFFVGGKPSVAIGDKVTAAGTVSEYFMNTEIDGTVVQSKVAGTPITPTVLSVKNTNDEVYESVLVTTNDVNAVVNPYSCAADDASCKDTLLWTVNSADNLPIIVWNDSYSGSDWATATTAAGATPKVTGVMTFRFNRRRIMPRSAADLVAGP